MKFSKWIKWSERENLDNIRNEGIYALARFNKCPSKVDLTDKNIIYIGITFRTLRQRWKEFDNSAFHGKPGHSGGWTYVDKIRDKGRKLYVSALPIIEDNVELRHAYISYLERKYIYEYTKKWGKMPLCNTK